MVNHSHTSLPVVHSDSSEWSSGEEESAPISKNVPAKIETKKKGKNLTKATETESASQQKKKFKKNVTVCLTNCRYDVVRRIASKFGYKEVGEQDNWNLYWTDLSISIERCKEMKRFQKINHFPGMLEICRKDLLARNLNRMKRLFPKDYNFFPKTWSLPADLGDALTYSRLRKNKTYILKPDAGSQGRGIVITKNLKDIKPSDRVICQVYITRPYLIDGFKFDLRVYTLITSCDPLRIYIYREGLVRFATSRYKEPTGVNITNVFMHLTNYAVNKHSRTYTVDNEAGSKRKLTWLNCYLRSLGHDVEKLWRNIDDVIIKTILSAWPVLKHSYMACFPSHDVIPACCELLGTDIILDKRLNPQILEVNHSPSFHTDTELDCEVKEGLLTDMCAMLNLEQCDKRKVLREDRKRVRERLLQGVNNLNSNEQKNFSECYRNEMKYRGGFRLVFPTMNGDHSYDKFFHQGQASLYCDTASSRARENAQAAFRDEMQLKAKMEAAKRVPSLKPPGKPPKTDSFQTVQVPNLKLQPSPRFTINSFEPQMIVEAEEKERLMRLSQRDYLVRSNGLLEYVYFSMKVNGTLRPQDERKYAIYDKIKTMSDSTIKSQGPAITDLLEGIRKDDGLSHAAPATWNFLSSDRLPPVKDHNNKRKKVNKLTNVKVA
ncbi:tubulin polyglutamylase ttll6-like [Onthophagus taurus]|uniref:tubulin polyglutamylase ttll6-like n=1 Tax=Onthophagus taurus TaxID=166361 RepID=UPI000C20340B|nr:tubulin polyglutamylase ttll6-like [Onthophagus taurus]